MSILATPHEAFTSLIVPVGPGTSNAEMTAFLCAARDLLEGWMKDWEVILVDNGADMRFELLDLDEGIRANVYVVKLAGAVNWDLAVLAGLERANGDFVVSFDVWMADRLDLAKRMHEIALQGFDIVHLRSSKLPSIWKRSLRRQIFFATMRLGRTGWDPRDRPHALITRRALNWIVRDHDPQWYVNEAFRASGFQIFALETELPYRSARSRRASAELAWSSLARSPRFLGLAAGSVIGGLICLTALTTLNALSVRIFGSDLLLQPQVIVPGWTYMVLLVSSGFAAIALLLYIVLRVQLVLLEEVRRRPRYVIERFSRI